MKIAPVVTGLTLFASSEVAAQQHYRLQTAAGAAAAGPAGE